MAVDTTFLPKTSGLVFSDRLTARANKGRVFLYTVAGDEVVEPPPTMEPITITVDADPYDFDTSDPIGVTVGGSKNVVVRANGPASPTFSWSARSGDVVFTPDNSGTTTITFNSAGFITCQCTLTDVESLENQVIESITFLVT